MMIRRATTQDLDTIVRLNHDIQTLHAAALPHIFKPPSDPRTTATVFAPLLQDPTNFFFLGYINHDIAVGYIYAQHMNRPENIFRYAINLLYIHHIGIVATYRHQHYGSQLLQEVVTLARSEGIRRIELDVWAFNGEAERFFAQHGFRLFNQKMALELPSSNLITSM